MKYLSQKMLTKLNLSSEELNYERYHYPCPVIQKRLHAIYIKAVTGFSNEMVGLAVGSHRNSIFHWLKTYQHDGLQQLMNKNYRPTALNCNSTPIRSLKRSPAIFPAASQKRCSRSSKQRASKEVGCGYGHG